jgi:hypothetical protein
MRAPVRELCKVCKRVTWFVWYGHKWVCSECGRRDGER